MIDGTTKPLNETELYALAAILSGPGVDPTSPACRLFVTLRETAERCDGFAKRYQALLDEDMSLALDDFDEAYGRQYGAKIRGTWAPRLFAGAFQQCIDDVGAENYLEMSFTGTSKAGEPMPFTVRIQRHEGKTPDAMRQEAVIRAEKAESEVKRLRDRLCASTDESEASGG